MEIQEVFDLVSEDLKKVETELSRNVLSQVLLIPEVSNYILLSGGKRFRPLILILAARFCGHTGNHSIRLASVFEFIHTASLLHDDVVDNAQIRRGNSSVNSVWGSKTSILIGDYLFSKSFSLLTSFGDLRVLNILSDATTRLAEGEIMELIQCDNPFITEEDYLGIITEKTAALISAACHVGAILGNAPYEKEMALKNFGLNLGIAFQLMDDLFDYASTEEELGKSIGKDLYEGKITLPLISTLRLCSKSEKDRIIKVIESENRTKEDVLEIINLARNYKGVDHTFEKAREYVQKAKSSLIDFESSLEKEALLTAADYVTERRW